MTEVLITGGTGLLGPYMKEAAGLLGPVKSCGSTSGDFVCDLTSETQVRDLITVAQPDLVVHCAAMTNVDPLFF